AGDANNKSASSGCGAESVVIDKNSPTLPTTKSAGGPIGTVLNDTATVPGGTTATGSIGLAMYGPNNTTSNYARASAVYTHTLSLTVNAATTTPTFTTHIPSPHDALPIYAGDANNKSASSGCGAESVVIDKNSPTLPTTKSAGGPIGTVLN